MRTVRTASLLFFVFFLSETVPAQTIQLRSITQTKLTAPTFATNARDGSGRLFILEQSGRILVVQRGSNIASVFLDLTGRVITSTERGLLGLVFHPDFANNHRFFVDYTRKSDGTVIVAEYHVSATNPNSADPQETVILAIPHPNTEHNGGMLAFGADGYLYISVGDGGQGNDPSNNAQNLNVLLGKILRIDIDSPASATVLYSSPPSNPFYGAQIGRDEIYAFGFRNPWRFSFDPATQELYVGDVGQDALEEIDIVEPGENYGWRVYEAWNCTGLGPAACNPDEYIQPIDSYLHTGAGGRCAVTGGYVYRGNKETLPFGAYIYGDYCTGEIVMLYHGHDTVLLKTTKQITSFGVDEEGEIYAVGGTVDLIFNPGAPSTPYTPFTMSGGGGVSFDTAGTTNKIAVDHAQIQPNNGDSRPAGLAFIELRSNGVLVSESAVPATALVTNGRFYGEVGPTIDTGVAIANPNVTQPASILFSFTDSAGNDIGEGIATIPAGGQLAAFLDQDPFDGPSNFNGSLTFTSSVPVSVIVLRGILNERSEFLTTTLPVVDLDSIETQTVVVPHLAAGGGWTTDIILLNDADDPISGRIQFLSPGGAPQTVPVDGSRLASIFYAIPSRSSHKFHVSGDNTVLVGSFVVTPDQDQTPPSVSTVYAYATGGITVSATGSGAAGASSQFDIYAEVAGTPGAIGSIQTGVAIANPSSEPVEVNYQLTGLNGSSSGISGSLPIPANGQTVSFIREFPGASALATPFQGLLHLSSPTPIAALAVRGRYNERGEFLLSTTPPADPAGQAGDQTFIPQVVDGAGYTTEIVIYDLLAKSPVSGNIYFFDQSGQPITPGLR